MSSEAGVLPPIGGGTKQEAKTPYDRVLEAIRDGSFPPGHILVETSLAEFCGVSRTPIREALVRLQQNGLVARTSSGLVVRERTPEEVLDIYETRISLEGTAAQLAAERHTQIDARRIQRVMHLAADAEEPLEQHVERNRDFHREIWKASHNESLIDLLEQLNLHLLRYPITTLGAPGRRDEAVREHGELVSAILDRDHAKAKLLAEQHFSRARDVRLERWEVAT